MLGLKLNHVSKWGHSNIFPWRVGTGSDSESSIISNRYFHDLLSAFHSLLPTHLTVPRQSIEKYIYARYIKGIVSYPQNAHVTLQYKYTRGVTYIVYIAMGLKHVQKKLNSSSFYYI